ncbi:hydrogenase nickel incorporation protein HypB [Lutimonas saemankumensis]|uniref:hydrogenase nickel incorporation protein HypB n=1 Tax=Lutimonas saemankumensis TaxID=483016 RepID=UPI001CD7C789|nr:hydrogenase nickel incorporation protein HypB [Lutimonas saemankumensis]MCA0933358.1 hydrogenase nickel incorporation protein HypB [Lutimonas saemankumensis]
MCGTCGCGSPEGHFSIEKPRHDPGGHQHVHHDHDHGHGHMHHDHQQEHHQHDHHHKHHGHYHEHEHGHHHEHEHGRPHEHHTSRKTVIEVQQNILQQNDLMAARNRGYFEAKNIYAINLVSSPGSGKTSILEKTLQDLKEIMRFSVIEGDQQTMQDANRIDALKVPVIQINTGKGCHLESDMIYNAVKKLDPVENSVLMIENVGNLVCPSMFDLGENKRIVIISVTEGEDKPLKYPDMFHGSDICLINKTDLLPYLDFDLEKLKSYALKVNPGLKFFEVSATTGEGMESWYDWMHQEIKVFEN